MATIQDSSITRRDQLYWAATALAFLILGTLILSFDAIFPSGNTFQLEVGDISPVDIFAPEDRTYISEVRTQEKRDEARARTDPVYVDVPDVGPLQLRLANDILEYIGIVRTRPHPTPVYQLEDLQAIEALSALNEETWISIRDASNVRWSRIAAQVIFVLERTLSLDIAQEDVNDEIRRLSSRVEASISDEEEDIIVEIVSQLIVPTIRLDEEATRAAQEAAAASVTQEEISFRSGSTIVSKGQELRPVDREALGQFGLLQQTENVGRIMLGSFILLISAGTAVIMYLARFYYETLFDHTMLALLAFLFIQFLLLALIFGPYGFEQSRLFPAAAMSLLIATLIGPHMAAVSTIALAALVATMLDDNPLNMAIMIAVGGLAGILALDKSERQSSYFYAGVAIGFANMGVMLATGLTDNEDPTVVSLIGDSGLAVAGGLFSAGIALVELGVISGLMNLTTSVRLIDLMRPDQPVLQRLLREAPGTFQHSLQVANLGELAAERIDADATLVRVAAMYHDIGKMLNPHFFVENQKGVNPHDFIDDPQRSAKILIGHVTEGLRMARRYRIPRRIQDFIREHHGTTKPFFYYKALEQANGDASKINEDDFRYPGPTPQSKETAILMLADSIESAARGIRPNTEEEVTGVVNMIFERVLQEGQLDSSHLTLNDLKAIREVFIDTLQGIYHTRIKYPGQEESMVQAPSSPPQLAQPTETDDKTDKKDAPEERPAPIEPVTITQEISPEDIESDEDDSDSRESEPE